MTTVVSCPSCGKRNRLPFTSPGHPRCAACHTDLPWIVEAADADFDRAIDASTVVLVDLWAPWCGPCRAVAPVVEAAAGRRAGSLKVVKVNVDEAPGVASRYDVQGIPTLLLLRDGQLLSRQTGALPADRLLAWTDQYVPRSDEPRRRVEGNGRN